MKQSTILIALLAGSTTLLTVATATSLYAINAIKQDGFTIDIPILGKQEIAFNDGASPIELSPKASAAISNLPMIAGVSAIAAAIVTLIILSNES